MTKTVFVINHMTKDIIVHACGCRDIEKDMRRANCGYEVEVPAGQTVTQAVVNDLNDGFGWTPESGEPAPWNASHVRLLPCAERVR